ncbi:hypothetical protein STRTUCAR8_07233 [Streptomyces turgidiscabies Car8]|uniref:Uncharacterized protein n=1 Tax=Streptomyces turgidiscabies (strain Car8) TaxID=698760 RepID=L7FCV9_STRT8|nr:hypothetical protein STRTUCAR8_07233 [Streptomyces turgidiscabies Car8]
MLIVSSWGCPRQRIEPERRPSEPREGAANASAENLFKGDELTMTRP